MNVVYLDDDGQTFVANDGQNNTKIPVPVILPGAFSASDRVAEVRLRSGKIQTFAGELLKTALANGAKLVRVLQEEKHQ